MSYIISIAISVLSGVLLYLCTAILKNLKKSRTEQANKDELLYGSVKCLLRSQLMDYHAHYMPLGRVPRSIYEHFDEEFQKYTALNGNGVVKRMRRDFDTLEIIED